VHWEIREKMEEVDVEAIVQRAREKFPGKHPRIITDNGPQFVSKDFKQFIRICGMTHVRTSPYYRNRTVRPSLAPGVDCGRTDFFPTVEGGRWDGLRMGRRQKFGGSG
jgi:transposase InsO family protein